MDTCVIGEGTPDGGGYLQTKVRIGPGSAVYNVKLHRLVAEQTYGPIPPGLEVCHTCDNPPCINPEHLFIGTRSDNMQDMHRKGRRKVQLVTHCTWGHAYTEDNTRHYRGKRHCRTCERNRVRVR